MKTPYMKKAVLIPDSFKGTISSADICAVMESSIREVYPDCTVLAVPVADGGEGSVDAFLTALGGERVFVSVSGPFFEKTEAFYGLTDNGKTAVIEMAAAAGLPLVSGREDPTRTTTYGVGELILDAARRGANKIIVGLGGSCTNDGGCGAAAAVGIRFLDKNGKSFVPTGATLSEIVEIDHAGRSPLLSGVEIVTMCDIDNPMYGERGAAYVFAPQKGADPDTVLKLDEGLRHLARVIQTSLKKDVSALPGGGAAGAMGAGMTAFFDSALVMGIEAVLDTVRFDEMIADADVIFTGEGRLDSQSLSGKAVIGIARRAKKQNKPVIAVVGGAEGDLTRAYDEGVTAVFTVNRLPEPLSVSRHFTKDNLQFAMENVLRLLTV